MKYKDKGLLFLPILALALVLAACGETNTTSVPVVTPATTNAATTTTAASVATTTNAATSATPQPAKTSVAVTPQPVTTQPVTTQPATTQPAVTQTNPDDQPAGQVLYAYYNAINQRDFSRAYALWNEGSKDRAANLQQFSAGFAKTVRVDIEEGEITGQGAAGTIYADIPVLISANNNDNQSQLFCGKYTLSRSNVDGGDKNWKIRNAEINPTPAGVKLGSSQAHQLLTSDCKPGAGNPVLNDSSSPTKLLYSYYNAVSLKDYSRAFNLWRAGNPDSPKNLQDFGNGFAKTAEVRIEAGAARIGAAAGSLYANIPVVIISTDTSGQSQTFAGTYVISRANEVAGSDGTANSWRIRSANIKQISGVKQLGDSTTHQILTDLAAKV